MNPTLRRELLLIAHSYSIKIRFVKQKTTSGLCFFKAGMIWINPEIDRRDEALSVLFHEICHMICYRKKLYWNYHNPKASNKKKSKIAVKAERFVDKMAKKELYLYDPECMFFESYQDNESAKWLKNYYLPQKPA